MFPQKFGFGDNLSVGILLVSVFFLAKLGPLPRWPGSAKTMVVSSSAWEGDHLEH
jgi:hypothetical protein